MGVKGVLRNVKQLGVLGTYSIYMERRLAARETRYLRGLRQELDQIKDTAKSEEKALASEIKQRERSLRAKFVKKVLPRVYNSNSKKPIERKIVIMERGAALSTNFSCLIQYLKKNTDYKIDIHILQANSIPVEEYYLLAMNYVRAIATAAAVFVCTANDVLGYIKLRPETTYIQLWHGCGAFKRFGLSTIDKKFGKSAASHAKFPVNTNYSYVTIASPEMTWIYEEAMGIEPGSGIITPIGVSRTDVFFDRQFLENSREKIEQIIPATKDKKIILYAPTFRGQVAKATSPKQLNIGLLAKSLASDYVLVVKHHQSARVAPKIPEKYEGSFAFDLTRGKGVNINELMSVADILITDYSSVAFEYYLFERPMIFFAFDLDQYIDHRGMYYDYDEITPGPILKTTEEIVDHILHIDERFDKREVIDFKNKFMSACDGHSTERIVRLIDASITADQARANPS